MLNRYPRSWRSSVAWYCVGISINAARANSASFLDAGMYFDMMSVKFTNYKAEKSRVTPSQSIIRASSIIIVARSVNLKVVKSSVRDVVVKLVHHIPRSVPDSDQYDGQWILAERMETYAQDCDLCSRCIRSSEMEGHAISKPCFHDSLYCFLFLGAQMARTRVNASCDLANEVKPNH